MHSISTPAMPRSVQILVFLLAFAACFTNIPYYSLFIPAFGFLLFTRQLHFSQKAAPAWLLMLGLAMAFLLSLPNAREMDIALDQSRFILYSFLFMVFVAGITERYGMQAIVLLLNGTAFQMLITFPYALAVLYGWIGRDDIVDPIRMQGFSGHPNAYGIQACLASTYLIYRFLHVPLPKKFIVGPMILCTLTALLLCYSRAAYTMTGLAIFSYLAYTCLQKRSGTALLKLGATMLVFAALIVIGYQLILSTDTGARRLGMQGYDEQRFMVNGIIWDRSYDKILGAGPAQNGVLLRNFYNNLDGLGVVHNVYLRILYETGLMGGLFFLAFLIYLFVLSFRISINAWPMSHISAMVAGLYYSSLINGTVVDVLMDRNFWMTNGLVVGLYIHYVRYRMAARRT